MSKVEFDTKTVELLAGYKDKEGTVHLEAEIREITGVDEEDVQKADIKANIGRVVTKLLANCTVRIGTLEKSKFKQNKWEEIIKELYLGDRDLLMMEIRKFTYGDDVELPFKCPHCKGEGRHIMEWDEIEINPLDVDPSDVSFELKKGARNKEGERIKEGTLRLPKGQDQELLDGIARKNMGLANTTLITRCVTSLGDIKLSSKVFKDLTSVDREEIVKVVADNAFGPNFRIDIDCPSCGERFETGIHPVNFL